MNQSQNRTALQFIAAADSQVNTKLANLDPSAWSFPGESGEPFPGWTRIYRQHGLSINKSLVHRKKFLLRGRRAFPTFRTAPASPKNSQRASIS